MNDVTGGQIVKANETYSPIVARVGITVRPGVLGDVPFIDRLQKQHSRELGFLPTAALEGKIKLGQVLVAEMVGGRQRAEGGEDKMEDGSASVPSASSPLSSPPSAYCPPPTPVGYLIAADRYQKRDEIGYVTQINVLPEYRRSLVAAQLLQAQFDRSAYGCRLYCCWCAQDLKANEFWEAMGFTAIAFRTGSMTRGRSRQKAEGGGQRSEEGSTSAPPASTARVHIFWQKRIRDGDTSTPWWYPSQTGGGVLREDRLVFPILPGVHWRDVGPILLEPSNPAPQIEAAASAPSPKPKRAKRVKAEPPTTRVLTAPRLPGGAWFEHEGVYVEVAAPEPEKTPKPKKPKPATPPIDPRLTAMSRELRDQWAERSETVVPPTLGKYDVKRIAQATLVEPKRLGQAA